MTVLVPSGDSVLKSLVQQLTTEGDCEECQDPKLISTTFFGNEFGYNHTPGLCKKCWNKVDQLYEKLGK